MSTSIWSLKVTWNPAGVYASSSRCSRGRRPLPPAARRNTRPPRRLPRSQSASAAILLQPFRTCVRRKRYIGQNATYVPTAAPPHSGRRPASADRRRPPRLRRHLRHRPAERHGVSRPRETRTPGSGRIALGGSQGCPEGQASAAALLRGHDDGAETLAAAVAALKERDRAARARLRAFRPAKVLR